MANANRSRHDGSDRSRERPVPGKCRFVRLLHMVGTLGSGLLSLLIGLLAAVLILYSGYVLYDSLYIQNTASSDSLDLLQYKPQIIEGGSESVSGGPSLADVTDDYRGWLTMYDTNIDYAIMQGEDDLYYAAHDIYGNSSITGAIFMAAANSGGFADSYNLLYGHHMANGSMFGSLDAFTDADYFDSHRTGVIVADSGIYDLTTFAVLYTNAYESEVYFVSGKSSAELIRFIESASPVIYRPGLANSSSKIIGFSTCASVGTDARLVVFAVMTPRDMRETGSGLLTLRLSSYEGAYDGQEHSITVNVNLDGATIEYSTDGGATWTLTPPRARYVNDSTGVLVRAGFPGVESVSAHSEIRIIPRLAAVTADDAQKTLGEPDPGFTATVTGTVGNDRIDYALTRPGAGIDEAPGSYANAIVASGDAVQLNGSYNVVYFPASFTIVEQLEPAEVLPGKPAPGSPPSLSALLEVFRPSGGSYGDRAWALVNLICLLLTAYFFLPLLHLKDKFGRVKLLGRLAAEDRSFAPKARRFRIRFRIGLVGELLTTLLALAVFLRTEDLRTPMILIDKWTPLMILLMALCLVIDRLAVRLRGDELPEKN